MPVYTLTVNDLIYTTEELDAETPLLWVLRDELNLPGTKYGCGKGLCGACTVHFDGQPMRSCRVSVSEIKDKKITTIEGLARKVGDELILHPVQQAWLDLDVPQCGYCQAGQIMSAVALLAKNTSPEVEEIEAAMSGNVCRCGTYIRIRKAIQMAARTISHQNTSENEHVETGVEDAG